MGKQTNKIGLNITDQIKHLREKKNINFETFEEEAKKYLLQHSYADVITPLKVLFSSGYCTINKCHLYETPTYWSNIKRLHEELQTLEMMLLQATLSLELELKSAFCVWLSDYLNDENISFIDFLKRLKNSKTIETKQSFFDLNDEKYTSVYKAGYADYENTTYNNRWWLLVMEMTFGSFSQLVKTIDTFTNEKILVDVLKQTQLKKHIDLYTIQILRNDLAHNTNILIFLDKPLRTKNHEMYKRRLNAIKFLLKYIGKSNLSNNSLVLQYSFIRNNPATNFKHLKV